MISIVEMYKISEPCEGNWPHLPCDTVTHFGKIETCRKFLWFKYDKQEYDFVYTKTQHALDPNNAFEFMPNTTLAVKKVITEETQATFMLSSQRII